MTSVQIDNIISNYVRHNLSPTKPERDMISARYDELRKFLQDRTFQNGSYARFTSTTPVNDLDVIYELPESVAKAVTEARIDPDQLDMGNILQTLASELSRQYATTATIKIQPHSVGIFFGEEDDFSIDVVPAIPAAGGLYWVPESAHHSVAKRRKLYKSSPKLIWIKSHPYGYIRQAQKLDEQTQGKFRKAAKFVKKWRSVCKQADDTFPLKSFHIEIVVTELMKASPAMNCLAAIERFFAGLDEVVINPQYHDLADQNRYIDAYVQDLTTPDKQVVIREQNRVKELVTQMSQASTEAQVIHAIEGILSVRDQTSALSTPVVSRPSVSPSYSKPYLP